MKCNFEVERKGYGTVESLHNGKELSVITINCWLATKTGERTKEHNGLLANAVGMRA